MTSTLTMPRERAIQNAINKGFPKLQTQLMLDDEFAYNDEQRAAAMQIADVMRAGGTAIVSGSEGNGKTLMACTFAVNWYWRGLFRTRGPASYFTVCDLMSAIKDWYRKPEKPSPLATAKEAGMLWLDELLVTHTSGHDQNTIRELVDTRYRNRRPTVILTNLGDEGLEKSLDRPTLDRIRDGGAMIDMRGQSLRGAKV